MRDDWCGGDCDWKEDLTRCKLKTGKEYDDEYQYVVSYMFTNCSNIHIFFKLKQLQIFQIVYCDENDENVCSRLLNPNMLSVF